jgi:hypothetical protein
VNYKSDAKTRALFEKMIGPHFHFTYHLNQYRLLHAGLTYGDLIDEWIQEIRQGDSRMGATLRPCCAPARSV